MFVHHLLLISGPNVLIWSPVAYQGRKVGTRALGRINTLSVVIQKRVFSRNLDYNMPKNAYFLE